MTLKILNLKINYLLKGSGNLTLLMIHGWGGSIKSYQPLINVLTKKLDLSKVQILAIDLPGFGKSQEPTSVWGIRNYTNFLEAVIKKLCLYKKNKLILIGHSFGGQVATYFAVVYPEYLDRLILIDPACIRKSGLLAKLAKIIGGNMKNKLKTILHFIPFSKKILTKLLQNYDYEKASIRMKKIMRKVLKEDLTYLLPKIKTKTMIIWGEKDSVTPPAQGIVIKKLIKNSKLYFIKDARHSPHITSPKTVAKLILDFINEL